MLVKQVDGSCPAFQTDRPRIELILEVGLGPSLLNFLQIWLTANPQNI